MKEDQGKKTLCPACGRSLKAGETCWGCVAKGEDARFFEEDLNGITPLELARLAIEIKAHPDIFRVEDNTYGDRTYTVALNHYLDAAAALRAAKRIADTRAIGWIRSGEGTVEFAAFVTDKMTVEEAAKAIGYEGANPVRSLMDLVGRYYRAEWRKFTTDAAELQKIADQFEDDFRKSGLNSGFVKTLKDFRTRENAERGRKNRVGKKKNARPRRGA